MRLSEAVNAGHLLTAEVLIAKGKDLNEEYPTYDEWKNNPELKEKWPLRCTNTPLLLASEYGNIPMLRLLIRAGIGPNGLYYNELYHVFFFHIVLAVSSKQTK